MSVGVEQAVEVTRAAFEYDGYMFQFSLPAATEDEKAMAEGLLRGWMAYVTQWTIGRVTPASRVVIRESSVNREFPYPPYQWPGVSHP